MYPEVANYWGIIRVLERFVSKEKDQNWDAGALGGRGVQCVFLTCFEWDFSFFAAMLRYAGVRLHKAETLDEADFLLTVTEASVLLSDVAFLDGFWQDAVDMLSHVHPRVACLVLAEDRDRRFVADAPNRGVFGVISKPLPVSTLRRHIETADGAVKARFAQGAAPLR